MFESPCASKTNKKVELRSHSFLPILDTLCVFRVSQILQVYCSSNLSLDTRIFLFTSVVPVPVPVPVLVSMVVASPLKELSPMGGKQGIIDCSSSSSSLLDAYNKYC